MLLYCFVALLLSIGAFNSNNNLLFLLFALSLSLILVSGVISGAMLMGVRVEREPLTDATVDGPVVVRYRVSNANRLIPTFALTIKESPALLNLAEPPLLAARRTPAGAARGRLDRELTAFAPHVGAGRAVTVEAHAVARARGGVALEEVIVESEFPFGIVRKSVRFAQPAELVVRPRPGVATAEATTAGGGTAPDGIDRRMGDGDQFFALREYHPGDSPRLISWRASARLSASPAVQGGADLLVRQATANRPRRLTVVLDLAPAASEQEYEQAISAAAGEVVRASEAGSLVGLCVRLAGEAEARRAAEARGGRWHVARLLNDLALLPPFGGAAPAGSETPAALDGGGRAGGAWVVVRAGRDGRPEAGGRG